MFAPLVVFIMVFLVFFLTTGRDPECPYWSQQLWDISWADEQSFDVMPVAMPEARVVKEACDYPRKEICTDSVYG